MPADFREALDRLERLTKPQEPAPDRFRALKAARDALVIEGTLALVLTVLGIAFLTHQGVITWP
jgi:hypothetical protein